MVALFYSPFPATVLEQCQGKDRHVRRGRQGEQCWQIMRGNSICWERVGARSGTRPVRTDLSCERLGVSTSLKCSRTHVNLTIAICEVFSLTLGRAKPPLLGFIIIFLTCTPQLSIWASILCAFSVPVLIKLKWELTRFSKSVASYCENLWGDRGKKPVTRYSTCSGKVYYDTPVINCMSLAAVLFHQFQTPDLFHW